MGTCCESILEIANFLVSRKPENSDELFLKKIDWIVGSNINGNVLSDNRLIKKPIRVDLR